MTRRPARRVNRRPVAEPLEGRAYLSAAVTFAPAVSFAAGTAPVALATADFNGDGHADLAVADATTEQVHVFFGTGTGTFTPGPVLALSAPPTAILSGDFNGDGRPDLAVAAAPGSANAGTTVTVFLANAGGTFGLGLSTTVETGVGTAEPIAIAAADFNADGHLDLVATEYTDNAVSVLLGTGSGTFAAPTVYRNAGSLPSAVAIGDFNGDGRADVAVATTFTAATGTSSGAASAGVLTLLGDGTGQFSTGSLTPLAATPGPATLTTGDLTGDGKAIDLAVGNDDGTVTLLVDDGSDDFTASASPAAAAASTGIAVADLNLDGHGDVVTADGGAALGGAAADAVTVLPGAGAGTVGTAAQFPVGSAPEGIAVADFNGDGRPDVATASEGAGTVSVLLNTTAVTTIATKTTLGVTPTALAPAGSAVALTAFVTPTAVSPLTGESVPTGSVSFYDGTTLIGTVPLTAGATAGVATASLSTAALTVGAHRLSAKYAADIAYAASASAAATETVTATATNGPDLVGTISSVTLPATVAPGEVGTVRVKIINQGNATAVGSITDTLYLSLDAKRDDADTPVPVRGSLAKATVKLATGRSVTLAGTFTVPADVPLGSYLLLVDVNAAGSLSESTTANNVTASPTAYTVADQFGTVGGKRGVALQLADGAGTVGTFRINGPGTGTLDVGDHGVDLTLTGTTAATAATITTARGATFHLHDLSARSAVGTIRGPAVAVAGTVDLAAAANTITLGDLSGATFSAGGGIRTLSVATWTAGSLTVPWIGTLRSIGTFGPTVDLTVSLGGIAEALNQNALTSLVVGGDDAAAVTAPVGRIGAVRVAGGMTGTVEATDTAIGSITVRGPVAAGVRFTSLRFPRRAILGGAAVDPATDPHFQISTNLFPLTAG